MCGYLFKRFIIVGLTAIFFAGGIGLFDSVQSANLTNTKVTLSTPRLSFQGRLASGNTVGSSVVTLDSSGAPSTGTYNLFVGETATIGTGSYEVIDVNDDMTLQIDRVLAAGDADEADPVIVARQTDMTVDFTPVSVINGGYYRVLVPAASANNADGVPDEDGWDAGATADLGDITVTCPGGTTAVKDTITSPGNYHSFTCPYTGLNDTTAKQMIIADLINPSPDTDSDPARTIGKADQYRILVQHLNGIGDVIDQTTTAVALIEGVRITASVAPSIELQLLGVNSSTAACGETTSETTTPTEVPLGELSIQDFTTAAQQLKVSTNAQNGYVVTAIAEDQLRRQHVAECTGNGDDVSGCIPDSAGDTNTMDLDTSDTWANEGTKGFAYSLDYVNHASGTAPTMGFEYDQSGSNHQYRQFADEEDGESPVTLFSSDTVADSHLVNICYKAIIGATQEAGEDYATNVTYRATATF